MHWTIEEINGLTLPRRLQSTTSPGSKRDQPNVAGMGIGRAWWHAGPEGVKHIYLFFFLCIPCSRRAGISLALIEDEILRARKLILTRFKFYF